MRKVDNEVKIEGYLRENGLELTRNNKQEEVIRGSLIVALDNVRSCKAQFYVNRFKPLKPGETTRQESKAYGKLVELLPGNTISIASLMKDHTAMTFDDAKELATKVWIYGALQEYVRKDEKGDVISSATIRGLSAGIKTESDKHPFTPKAGFEVEMYIEGKRPEMKDGEETGRIVLTGLIPEYDDSVSRIDFIATTDYANEEKTITVADYIEENYNIGQTVKIYGDVINTYVRVEKEGGGHTFGRTLEPQYETTFISERQIFGGTATPLDEDDENALKKAEIKAALALRQQKIDETSAKDDTPKVVNPKRGFTEAPATTTASRPKFTFDRNDF